MNLKDASPEIEDDDLIQSAFEDPAAFGLLYRRYAPSIYRYAYACVGNQHDAQDLTAQIFIEVLEALPRYRPRGQFAAWLFTIARRRAIDFGRRQRVEGDIATLEKPPSGDPPLDEVMQNEDLLRLTCMLDDLNDQERELIHLRYAAGMSYAQMSSVLRRSRPALRMAMHRLLRRLRRLWEAHDE